MIEVGTQRRSTHRRKQVVSFGVLLFLFLLLFLPLYWLLITSIKPNQAAFKVPPELFPSEPTLESYISQLQDRAGFLTYFLNSVIASTFATLLSITVSVLAGYAFSRFRFPAKRAVLVFILASQMFPLVVLLVGIYVLFRQLNLLDTYLGLILAFTSFSLPFSIWMMRGFFDTVPPELEQAAMVDGATRLQALLRVILPLVGPGVIAVGLYSFLNAWNNLLFALSLTSSQNMRTIPPGFLLTYVGEFQYQWADAMAGSVMVSLPMIVVFIFLQRYLIRGMTAGAVKG
jgi:multiple sugar transport system permease protein